ncbi:rhomboid family intramembrane serine protease [Actinomadura macrotermitis]|uniref:Rhomboid protease GlpG n=1 Tax=Actinomadura macrotermitis TaxID=2585200 RepID=A0A7K0BVE5_9ACTN|nr:rhomboid family intramembrane serine protease [Actinomadura macrotermitis]MQY05148.1 Rhomboid protease GlpG [Actinomadura macrotermitis]
MTPERPSVPEAPAPVCYRHPGRETHVRCTRCDRPICPECMREAAVGHQCVECVAEGRRSVRRPRTVLGAPARAGARPVVTYTLIGLCVLAYLGELATDRVFDELAMIGLYRFDGGATIGVAEGEWYRLLSSMFLHQPPDGGSFWITHILFNMYALWALGPQLEQVLGRGRFLALYLLSGLGGSVLAYLLAPGTPVVGASGAIFGLFGAYFVIARRLGTPPGPIVFLLVLNLVITFSVPGISWQGHVGGLVTGTVLAAAYAYAPARHRQAVQIAATAAVLVLLVVLTAVKTTELV